MTCICQEGMQCWRLLDTLKRICPVFVALGLIATGAYAQTCEGYGPQMPCWFNTPTYVGAVSPTTDRLDLFAADNRGYIYQATWQGAAWQGWSWINGVRIWPGGSVTAVSRSTDKIDLFTVGPDFRVWSAAWDSANGWHGWWTIGNITVPASTHPIVTAVSCSTDKLDIFMVGDDGQVYTAAWQPGFSSWHGPWALPGVKVNPGNSVAAVSRVTDALDIFVVDVNGAVQTASRQPGFTAWSSWHPVSGMRTMPYSAVTAVKWNTNFVNLFLTDVNGNIQTTLMFPAFAGWQPIGRADPGAIISGISSNTNQLDVFVATAGNVVLTNHWESVSSNWTGWQVIPNFVALESDAITAVSRSLDKIDLYSGYENANYVWTAARQGSGNPWSVFPILLPVIGYPGY